MSRTQRRAAQRAAIWLTALAMGLLLGASCAQQEPSASPFAELISQGLTRYLGAAKPAETVEGGGYVTWHFDPADGPMCLRGAPFAATARDGDSDKLIVYLQGGGACWSDLCQAIEVARAEVAVLALVNVDVADAVLPMRWREPTLCVDHQKRRQLILHRCACATVWPFDPLDGKAHATFCQQGAALHAPPPRMPQRIL